MHIYKLNEKVDDMGFLGRLMQSWLLQNLSPSFRLENLLPKKKNKKKIIWVILSSDYNHIYLNNFFLLFLFFIFLFISVDTIRFGAYLFRSIKSLKICLNQ